MNTFPRLPVREGEHAFVWFARYDDLAAYQKVERELGTDPRWGEVRSELERRFAAPEEIWKLTPTARSRVVR